MVILSGQEMNGEQIIPPITDPLGKHWQQPHRRFIELDNTHALMSEQTFKGLKEYSTFPQHIAFHQTLQEGVSDDARHLPAQAPHVAGPGTRPQRNGGSCGNARGALIKNL